MVITNTSFTQKDILGYLENFDQEDYHFFIDFEHPYFYTAGSRLTLFADNEHWAFVFEKSGYQTGNDCGEIELTFFGNCLQNLTSEIQGDTKTSNVKSITIIEYDNLREIESDFREIAHDKACIKVRDVLLPIEQNMDAYFSSGIQPNNSNSGGFMDVQDLVRYLNEKNPHLFRATEAELRQCLPGDIPILMQIDQWNHQPYFKHMLMVSPSTYEIEEIGIKPGENETYRLIADILVTKDITKWKPTLAPNNNWRNWPRAGHF